MPSALLTHDLTARISGSHDVSLVGRAVSRHLDKSGVAVDVAYGVVLVLAELVTNAIEHGRARTVEVGVSIHDDSVWLRLEHRDHGIAPDPQHSSMPPATSCRGRGMAIAVATATSIRRDLVGDVTITHATFDRPTPH